MPKDTFFTNFFSTYFTKNGRNRYLYFFLISFVVIIGLTSRNISDLLPDLVNLFIGDSLWALMIFLMTGFIFRKYYTEKIVMLAATFCYLIEISQLYHASWIDAIRSTTPGSLILGFTFLWSDIFAYSLGIFVGWFAEKTFKINATISSSSPEDDHL